MSLTRLIARVQRQLPRARRGTLVLAYHLVGADVESPINISVDRFKRQLDVLQEHFRLLPLEQALSVATSGVSAAALTFDDAYGNFAEVVWPILLERRIPAILYVPTGFVLGETHPPIQGTRLRPCTWAELRAMSRDGLEIGSHGVDHLNLRHATPAALERELVDSRALLESELSAPIKSFCYPQAKFDTRAVRAVARHYDSAVVAGGRRYSGGNRHRIPRFPVRSDEADFEAFVLARLWLREALASGIRQWRR